MDYMIKSVEIILDYIIKEENNIIRANKIEINIKGIKLYETYYAPRSLWALEWRIKMRKITFFASVIFFLIIISIICTGSWKNISLAKDKTENIDVDIKEYVQRDLFNKLDGVKKDGKEEKHEYVAVERSEKTLTGSATQESDRKANDNALFIGDSRTVGIAEYAGIKNADFYANVGLSVYNVFKEKANVKGRGRIGIDKMLTSKEYGKVYIMIGINELGYNFKKTVEKYEAFISYISKKQPYAKIIIQSNLHVTKERARGDKIINNKMINRYNATISKLANDETIFYIDANKVFDDKEGNLAAKLTYDGVHILAKYYKKWGEWIVKETSHL